jgi:Amt family ammonium transporter
MAWMFAEWSAKGKPSLLGLVSGAVAGLVAVTPASGFAGPMGSLVLGLVAGVACFLACTSIKNAFRYDDSLDVFGVHCIGGIIGAIATGILVNPKLGGTGILDYVAKPGEAVVGEFVLATQVIAQCKAVALTLAWSGIVSAVLYKLIDIVVGLRPVEEKEREGLDLTEHGERAYNY